MKATRLTVRRINQRGVLPDDTQDRTLLLFSTDGGLVRNASLYRNHPTCLNAAPHGVSHYVVLPGYLHTASKRRKKRKLAGW